MMRFNSTQHARYGVVVVDPVPQRMQALVEKLRTVPAFDVEVLASAYAAVNAINGRRPALVVTELDLPDMNGVDFVTALHNTPATRDILLMVVTGRSGIRDKIAAFRAGADEFLVQPVNPDYFLLRAQLLTRLSRRTYSG